MSNILSRRTITELSMVAAVSTNGVIGRDGDLPWSLPNDMKYFRQMTLGKPIIMGRKTYQSIGRPLPRRTNIILTRDKAFTAEGCFIAHTPQDALNTAATHGPNVALIGGTSIYTIFMPVTTHLYMTHVEAHIDGDAYFPEIDPAVWQVTRRETHEADEQHAYRFYFVDYQRR